MTSCIFIFSTYYLSLTPKKVRGCDENVRGCNSETVDLRDLRMLKSASGHRITPYKNVIKKNVISTRGRSVVECRWMWNEQVCSECETLISVTALVDLCPQLLNAADGGAGSQPAAALDGDGAAGATQPRRQRLLEIKRQLEQQRSVCTKYWQRSTPK